MTIRTAMAAGTSLAFFLVAGSVDAAQVNLLTKLTGAGDYSLELEVQDFGDALEIDLVHPLFGTFPLAFDAGENNWDVEQTGLLLTELSTFFSTGFELEITQTGGQSIYQATSLGSQGTSSFPTPASVLDVDTDDNPLRPTANWQGGDGSATALIITYGIGNDEFTDGFVQPAVAEGSQTLGQDLKPGFYTVALGFYNELTPAALALLTGDDVLEASSYTAFAVGETLASVDVIPLPAAGWLMLSALAALLARGRMRQPG